MTLYDKNGNLFDTSKFVDSMVAGDRKKEFRENKKYVKSFFYEDPNGTILKVLNEDVEITYKQIISKSTFDILKEMDNPNLVKILDYYFFYKNDIFQIDAYTMKKVHSKKEDLLNEDKAILLDYLSDLQRLASELAKKRIFIQDSNERNILFTSNGPVIIDLDYYYKSLDIRVTKKAIETHNKKCILKYLYNYAYKINYNNLYDKDENLDIDDESNENKIKRIFANKDVQYNTDIVKKVEDKLTENTISKQLKLKRTN